MAATAKAASPAAAPREAAFVSESWEEVERSLRGLASSEAQLVVFASAWHPTGCAFGVAVATARSEHRFALPVSVVLADDETKGAGAFLCSQGVFGPPAIALFSGGASHAAAMPVVLRTESLGDLTAGESCSAANLQWTVRRWPRARVGVGRAFSRRAGSCLLQTTPSCRCPCACRPPRHARNR